MHKSAIATPNKIIVPGNHPATLNTHKKSPNVTVVQKIAAGRNQFGLLNAAQMSGMDSAARCQEKNSHCVGIALAKNPDISAETSVELTSSTPVEW